MRRSPLCTSQLVLYRAAFGQWMKLGWKFGHRLQLIPAAQQRDHLPVLVLLSLRMRRVGQDQQRMHRWDFDRMATALQPGSVERASFLKELGKNMMEQSEQMEKALSAPASDEAWKLWIQAIVETGKKFFAHTKELHTTEETRRANQERWALLRRRQVIRQQLEATAAKGIIHAQEPWTAFHFRIRELGRILRAALRRSQAQAEENMLAELQ